MAQRRSPAGDRARQRDLQRRRPPGAGPDRQRDIRRLPGPRPRRCAGHRRDLRR